MSFEKLYRVSFYVMMFLATLAQSIDTARDVPLAPLFPLAVAVVGVLAFRTVDRDPRRGMPLELAKMLAFGSIALFLLELNGPEGQTLAALGHWLVYLQLVKMLLPKSVEDDWFLFLLGLVQVVIGAFQPGERVGLVIIAWAVAALWTLRLFHLRREAVGAGRAASDPYPGLVDRRFVQSIAQVAVLTLLLGGVIFLVLPRWTSDRGRRFRVPVSMPQRLTGFSDTVKLGQMGEILENDTIVMSVELYDEDGRKIEAGEEPLWRGVALQSYADKQWTRRAPLPMDPDDEGTLGPLPGRRIRQRIRLEPADTDILFGMRPFVRAEGADLAINRRDGSIYRSDIRPTAVFVMPGNRNPGTYPYTVITPVPGYAHQPGELEPNELDLAAMQELPEGVEPTLSSIVGRVLAGIPEGDNERRARALEAYFRDSGEFRYTLQQTIIDPSIDPVEDFLLNRKQGHCEYFASALALLLRSAGIPSRMVNGFKGGDWNPLGALYYVRQKHAHSWVEAYLGTDAEGDPRWLTLDPAPPAQREETVARVGGINPRFRTFSDFIRYLWIFYVIGFDNARQEALIYGPLRAVWREARQGFAVMGAMIVRGVRWLLHFPSGSSFFSVRGFIVSFTVLSLLALLARLVRWLARKLGWWGGGEGADLGDFGAGVASYRRLVELLAGAGLRRPPPETPREFARRASEQLSARGPGMAAVAGVPAAVVELFYGVRYGGRRLAEAELRRAESGLDALEAALQPAK